LAFGESRFVDPRSKFDMILTIALTLRFVSRFDGYAKVLKPVNAILE